MTHEQYIALETSKLAKQAKFDWECIVYYGCSAYDEGKERSFTLLKDNYYGIQNWNEKELWDGLPRFSAPTQSVLQRWLREVKGYNVYISHTYTAIDCQIKSIWEVLYEKMTFLKPNSTLILEDDLGRSLEFDTYEDALEAGLQECLTLIIERNDTT